MKKKIFAGLLGVTFCVLYFAVAMVLMPLSYGWFSNGQTMFFTATGSSVASYFAGGTGTKNDPYIIATPRHLYNFAWLQYLGTFNITDSAGNLTKQFYFELDENLEGDVLNMEGSDYQVIPPIGTMEYPFVGYFNGNGKTIANVVIANVVGGEEDKDDKITVYPPAIEIDTGDPSVRYAEIIGFFGVIGEYNGVGKVTDDQLKELVVENLNLDNITIATSTTSSLAGLFAGYVNGTAKNVNVLGGTIDTAENVLPYTETFNVTGKDAEGNSVIKEFILNAAGAISNYTLIGDYLTTLIKWEGGGVINGPSTDVGQGQGFGGSIDMLSLAKRLTYMYGVGDIEEHNQKKYYYQLNSSVATNNHAVVSFYNSNYKNDNKVFNYTNNATQTLFFNSGTYLPLNIDGLTTLSQDKYTKTSVEPVLDENTGFIVGNRDVGSTTLPLNLKNKLIGQLCNSMKGGSSSTGAWKNFTYSEQNDGASLQILTKDVNGNYYVIGDNVNGLATGSDPYGVYKNAKGTAQDSGATITVKTYSALGLTQYDGKTANRVRTKLGEMLESSNFLYGLQFNKSYNKPSKDAVLSFGTNTVSLGGEQVNSLVKDTIHFYVKDSGVMTMVVATVSSVWDKIATERSSSDSYVLPMLYQVVRDENGNIQNLVEITVICKDNNTGQITYNDTLVDGKVSGKTVLYNYTKMGRLTTASSTKGSVDWACMQSLFYFEIPVASGEYVLGNAGNYVDSPFVVYLDIGGNAGSSGGSGEGGSGGTEPPPKPTGEISGIAFAYQNGTTYTKITHDGTNVVTYKISGPKNDDGEAITHNGAVITFTPSSASGTAVAFTNNNTGQFAVSKNDPPNTGSGGSG